MKNFVSNLKNAKVITDPRYGKVLVVDPSDTARLQKLDVAYAIVNAGATTPPHYHERTEEVYAIAKGSGIVLIDGVATPVGPGDTVLIPVYTVHAIMAGPDGCEFTVATTPPYCEGDDFETDAVTVEKPTNNNNNNTANGTPVKIAVVISTHRAGSVSAKIARQIAELYSELGVKVDLIDPAELPNELFHAASYERRYETDSLLAQRLIAADGLVFCVAEYNGSLPGVLKHLLDILPYEQCFGGKATCLVGVAAGDFGGLRALDHLGAVLMYRSANVFGVKVYVRNVDEAPIDERGHLTDPEIVGRLRSQAAGFATFVRKLSAP